MHGNVSARISHALLATGTVGSRFFPTPRTMPGADSTIGKVCDERTVNERLNESGDEVRPLFLTHGHF